MNSNNIYIYFFITLSLMNNRSGVQSLPISKIDWCINFDNKKLSLRVDVKY